MSHEGIGRALAALRDVAGVHGSFVLKPTGELVGKDLPAVFHDELFVEVGARLSRFVETMAADGDEVTSAILRFDEHRLYVTRFAHGLLAVITANDINASQPLRVGERRLLLSSGYGTAQRSSRSATRTGFSPHGRCGNTRVSRTASRVR